MRKKMRSGLAVVQCSMFFLNDRLYTAVGINKRNGEGKVIFGIAHKKRMRVIHSLAHFRNVSDIEVFNSFDGVSMMAVSQSLHKGKCLVFRKNFDIDDG